MEPSHSYHLARDDVKSMAGEQTRSAYLLCRVLLVRFLRCECLTQCIFAQQSYCFLFAFDFLQLQTEEGEKKKNQIQDMK